MDRQLRHSYSWSRRSNIARNWGGGSAEGGKLCRKRLTMEYKNCRTQFEARSCNSTASSARLASGIMGVDLPNCATDPKDDN